MEEKKNLNCMEEKVDYSKDIQVTIDNNQTFPAKLLANDPEFGVIVGYTNENGEKWIHSELYNDYESINRNCFGGFLMFQKLKRDQL